MSEITLSILASDIENTDYMQSEDCAITRALARAGRSDLKDVGRGIIRCKDPNIFNRYIINWDNPSYQELASRVILTYEDKNPEDFTHVLTY